MLPRPLITDLAEAADGLLGTSGNGTETGGHWWNDCHLSESCQVSCAASGKAHLFLNNCTTHTRAAFLAACLRVTSS